MSARACPSRSACSGLVQVWVGPSLAATRKKGYDVVLVARSPQGLDVFAKDLSSLGVSTHVITADLADTAGVPALSERIRAAIGELDAMYYAPTPGQGFVPAVELAPRSAEDFMPLLFYTHIALVQEFLPHMVAQGFGATLTAQGASTLHGLPNMSGSGPAQAAQRNYLQLSHTEVADEGVYVGMLYIGAVIANSAFHTYTVEADAAGAGRYWGPTVSPDHLADLLWTMHNTTRVPGAKYPA